MKYIDFRSDTVTMPTDEMREAMAKAEVGDDIYGDDPTMNHLQSIAANMVKKEAALFVPSGTMGNQIAIMTHTKRGDEIIVEENCHIIQHEVGAAAVLSNVQTRCIKGIDGIMQKEDVEAAIRGKDIHYPDTGLICIENALSNGTVISIENMQSIYDTAKKYNLPVHLDGARLFNASMYLGVEAYEICKHTDSVMFCLSKGLCAPVGSILAGSFDFIEKAKKNRKLLGGAMRQTGILAAAGIIALEKMTKRLKDDHDNAKYLTQKLSQIEGISVDTSKVHINMVFFDISKTGIDPDSLVEFLLKNGIKSNGAENGLMRFVTNNDISLKDIDYTVDIMKDYIEK